jgi:hypothetical protein
VRRSLAAPAGLATAAAGVLDGRGARFFFTCAVAGRLKKAARHKKQKKANKRVGGKAYFIRALAERLWYQIQMATIRYDKNA